MSLIGPLKPLLTNLVMPPAGPLLLILLGGGVKLKAPEYGEPILANDAHMRLRYGIHLARQTRLPLVFSGGKGWAAPEQQTFSEADVAVRTLQLDAGMRFAWVDEQSRDTRENAELSYAQLAPKGITRIALVTNDWHMQRSVRHFEQAGFVVHPAPMGYVQPPLRWETDYLPSGHGLSATRHVLREWLGQLVDRLYY